MTNSIIFHYDSNMFVMGAEVEHPKNIVVRVPHWTSDTKTLDQLYENRIFADQYSSTKFRSDIWCWEDFSHTINTRNRFAGKQILKWAYNLSPGEADKLWVKDGLFDKYPSARIGVIDFYRWIWVKGHLYPLIRDLDRSIEAIEKELERTV